MVKGVRAGRAAKEEEEDIATILSISLIRRTHMKRGEIAIGPTMKALTRRKARAKAIE